MSDHMTTRLTDEDVFLFNEGTQFQLYDKLGSHVGHLNGQPGTYFAVWAPELSRAGRSATCRSA